MSKELLPYYNNELDFLRREAEEFAKQHPAAAFQLGLAPGAAPDPHVERLLQGVAFLNARIHHRLDDDFPEIIESLLNTLCPQYLAPFPSCAIAEFSLQQSQAGADSAAGFELPAGETVVQSSPDLVDGSRLEYRTAYDVHLLPIRVASARYIAQPFPGSYSGCLAGSRSGEAAALLHIELETLSPELSFSRLPLESLRFFLSGQLKPVNRLAELILRCTLQVVLCNDLGRPAGVRLSDPRQSVRSVGFTPEESLLPADARVLPGHRLVREYFAFPQKFHFVELRIPPRELPRLEGTKLHLLFLLKDEAPELESVVRGDTIRLHATPVVNLFQKRAAPISLTRQRVDYPLQFDDRTPLDYEVFSIKSVAATSSSRETRQYKSFYDIDRGGSRQPHGYWRLSRRRMAVGSDSADRRLEQEASLQGWLSLTDLEMQPSRADDWVVHVEATCVNRAPHRRWTGASAAESGRVTWSLVGGGAVGQVRLVTVPTAPLRWPAEKGWRWRILSHLSLNHLSLSETEAGVAPLREILELYNPSGGKVLSEQIRGLLAISCRRVTRRIDRASSGVVRGLEARLHLDSAAFPLGDLFLFGSVLQAFLSGYCTINSFVETVLTTSHSEGEYHRWPATAGTRSIL